MGRLRSMWLPAFDPVVAAAELELEDKIWFTSNDIFHHLPETKKASIYVYIARLKELKIILEVKPVDRATKEPAKLQLAEDYQAIRERLINAQKKRGKGIRPRIPRITRPPASLPIRALLDQSLDCVEKLEELLPALKKALLDLHKNLAAFEDIRKILGSTREVVARAPTVS